MHQIAQKVDKGSGGQPSRDELEVMKLISRLINTPESLSIDEHGFEKIVSNIDKNMLSKKVTELLSDASSIFIQNGRMKAEHFEKIKEKYFPPNFNPQSTKSSSPSSTMKSTSFITAS